jgi:hypothetical protein
MPRRHSWQWGCFSPDVIIAGFYTRRLWILVIGGGKMKVKKKWWKIVLVSLATLIIYGILHQFQPNDVELKAEPSLFIEQGIFLPLVVFFMFLSFCVLGIIYIRVENALPRNKVIKGFLFSLAFAGFWFIGFLEPILLFNESVRLCIFLGVVDSIAIFILGGFLGRFLSEDSPGGIEAPCNSEHKSILSIAIIGLFFLIGRYISYAFINIHSVYATHTVQTLIWTLGIGLSFGLTYWILGGAGRRKPIKQAVWFGIGPFGVMWIMYNLFNLLFVKHSLLGITTVSVVGLAVKVAVDILFVMLGIYIFERFYTSKERAAS